jgi:hypothetical protein
MPYVKRREFITLIGAAAAWPLAARAQPGERMRRVGVLMSTPSDDPESQARLAVFVKALEELGWTDGRNVQFDVRFGTRAATTGQHAAEMVALAPDVVLAQGSGAAGPLLQVTHTVPIVFVIVPDPVGAGFVASLARPGGNATGFLSFEYSIGAKWLELLKEVMPGMTRAAVMRDPAIRRARSVRGSPGRGAVARARGDSGQCARPEGDRARHRGLRARAERRPDRDGERVSIRPSPSDCEARGPAQTACGLCAAALRRSRRTDLLWAQFLRSIPTRGGLRQSHPQGREAR